MTGAVKCPYCQSQAELVTGKVIYPHRQDLHSLNFWRCAPCDAYVACHKPGKGYGDGSRPLGRLANGTLRRAKRDAHEAFDPIWKLGGMKRKDAYVWLAKELGIGVDECHIGEFDADMCCRVVGISNSRNRRLGRDP